MSELELERKRRVEAIWLAKLREVEQRYRDAIATARDLVSQCEAMPPAHGDLALDKAVQLQTAAMNEYARILDTFTRLILYGEHPGGEPFDEEPQ